MSEGSLADAVGIDRSAEEALTRAGVRTVKELVDADAEALAMASGVPLERIKEWQARARRAGARRARNPVATGWLIAIAGLVLAVLVGWIMLSIGARRIEHAQQLRTAAESQLEMAMEFAAEDAIEAVRAARLELQRGNWGRVEAHVRRADDLVAFMAQMAPERSRRPVAALREELSQLQRAVEGRAGDTGQRLNRFETALDDLRRQGGGR